MVVLLPCMREEAPSPPAGSRVSWGDGTMQGPPSGREPLRLGRRDCCHSGGVERPTVATVSTVATTNGRPLFLRCISLHGFINGPVDKGRGTLSLGLCVGLDNAPPLRGHSYLDFHKPLHVLFIGPCAGLCEAGIGALFIVHDSLPSRGGLEVRIPLSIIAVLYHKTVHKTIYKSDKYMVACLLIIPY